MTPTEAIHEVFCVQVLGEDHQIPGPWDEGRLEALAALGYEVRSIDSTEGGRASGAPSGGVSPVPPSVEQVDDDAS